LKLQICQGRGGVETFLKINAAHQSNRNPYGKKGHPGGKLFKREERRVVLKGEILAGGGSDVGTLSLSRMD